MALSISGTDPDSVLLVSRCWLAQWIGGAAECWVITKENCGVPCDTIWEQPFVCLLV